MGWNGHPSGVWEGGVQREYKLKTEQKFEEGANSNKAASHRSCPQDLRSSWKSEAFWENASSLSICAKEGEAHC